MKAKAKKIVIGVVGVVAIIFSIGVLAMLPPETPRGFNSARALVKKKANHQKKTRLDVFWGLVGEYNLRLRLAAKLPRRDQREGQAFRAYLVHGEIFSVYSQMPESERQMIFSDPRADSLPLGVNISGWGQSFSTGGSKREDFEAFLRDSYGEIDYMSEWSIAPRMDLIEARYMQYLVRRGLKSKG